MEQQPRELEEEELADNRLHFKQVLWKMNADCAQLASVITPTVQTAISKCSRLHRPPARRDFAKAQRCLFLEDTAADRQATHLQEGCPTSASWRSGQSQSVFSTEAGEYVELEPGRKPPVVILQFTERLQRQETVTVNRYAIVEEHCHN